MSENLQGNICIECIGEEDFFPKYASSDAAGADVRAFIDEEISINSGERQLIPTGLKCAIPQGYEIQVRPRSGLALKNGVTVLNAPGTIDSDYRGEIGVILINYGKEPFIVKPAMRIAQLVVAPVVKATFVYQEELSETVRSIEGFGSTGVK